MSTDLIKTYNLTPLQAVFVTAYFENEMNASKAARQVGCTPQIMQNVTVKQAIAAESRTIAEMSRVRAVNVVRNLMDIANANIDDYWIWKDGERRLRDNLTREELSCVKSMVTDKDGRVINIEMHDKMAATDRLTKILELGNLISAPNEEDNEPLDKEDAARRLAFLLREAAEKAKQVDAE